MDSIISILDRLVVVVGFTDTGKIVEVVADVRRIGRILEVLLAVGVIDVIEDDVLVVTVGTANTLK